MKLYHGTNIEFGFIDLEKCPHNRDFGQGFYLTNIRKHAQGRAQDKVDADGGRVTVMEFDFDIHEVMVTHPALKIKYFERIDEEWARFVMYNRLRKENEPKHEYDIVEGPVANDKMFRQFQRFLSNQIKLNEFIGNLKFHEATHQIAFCTDESIDLLLEYNTPPRYKIETLVSELSVALMQDRNLSKLEAMNAVYDSGIFTNITDVGTGLYQRPWTEIYQLLLKELKD
ncbi:MAG: DUF3990 domain-containing protein [Tannerella sp.]|jgi:hypothetical protein|nr:DUF3990 domain-containing protein [Tannerella sp.]